MFITFEGPEGSGKSTQIRLLYEYLVRAGRQVLLTREPGGTSIGDQIRAILHDLNNRAMRPRTEILLYSASRAQLVDEVIRPALAAGQIVLCDRYAESTMAYQGYGRGIDLAVLESITHFATGGLRPDLIIYLDIPVEIGLARKRQDYQKGHGEWTRLDAETVAFHQRVRDGYLTMAAADPDRWLTLDATRPIEMLHREICAVVEDHLGRERPSR